MKNIYRLAVVFALCFVLFAQMPEIISFEAILTTPGGAAYHDIAYEMQFRLFPGSTSPLEVDVWEGIRFSVHIEYGLSHVFLGHIEPISFVPFAEARWLEVEVDGEVLSPRYEVIASPFDFFAYAAGTARSDNFILTSTYSATADYEEFSDYSAYDLYADTSASYADTSAFTKFTSYTNTSTYADYEQPNELKIGSFSPNPFNSSTQIQVEMPEDALLSLSIYDLIGKEIYHNANNQKAGVNTLTFVASDELTTGIYLYKIKAGNSQKMGKFILAN